MSQFTRRLFLGLTLALTAVLGGALSHFGTVDAQNQFANNCFLNGADISSTPGLNCTGLDTNVGFTLATKAAGDIALNPGTGGFFTLGNPRTLVTTFYSALHFCKSDNALLIPTRVAANDWALARTAAGAETYNVQCQFPLPGRVTASKGWRLDSFAVAEQITVVNLTSHAFNALATTAYSNNVANAVAAYGGAITITLPTVVQANPYFTTGTLGTPAFMTTAQAQTSLDFTAVMANTGVWRLYGVWANYTLATY